MQYNELGQEIERILPGDVISKWQYDITGRPTHHRVRSQNRDTRRRVYNWDVNHQLRSMVNELTGIKATYGYDEFSNLVWANQNSRQFDFLYRSVDDVGNLYETKDKTDRIYDAGSCGHDWPSRPSSLYSRLWCGQRSPKKRFSNASCCNLRKWKIRSQLSIQLMMR